MKFTLLFPLNGNSSVKCAGLFCASNRGALRLQTGPVVYARLDAETRGDSTGAVFGCVLARLDAGTRGDSTGAVLGCVHAQLDADTRGESTGAVFGPVVHSRCGADTSGDSTGAILGQGVHVRVLGLVPMARQRRKPVELPQVQFLDTVYLPVVVVSGAYGQTAQKTRGDSTGAVLGQGSHARLCRKPVEIPQVQFLDNVYMPFCAENPWRLNRCSSWTRFTCPSVQKTRGDSTGTVPGHV